MNHHWHEVQRPQETMSDEGICYGCNVLFPRALPEGSVSLVAASRSNQTDMAPE